MLFQPSVPSTLLVDIVKDIEILLYQRYFNPLCPLGYFAFVVVQVIHFF